MTHRFRLVAALLTAALVAAGSASSSAAQRPPTDPTRFHLFVLAGQSNMAGRGVVEAQDSVAHPRVWMLDRELRWVPAVEPMHFDKPIAGVGPGRSFGIALAEADPTIHVGLVPAAVGGSSIATWVAGAIHRETGAHPYDDAIARTMAAMRDGELKGILWHQGESDSSEGASAAYHANLLALIARFREAAGSPDLLFMIGQLGRFPQQPWSVWRERVDAAHRVVAAELPGVAYVSAEGLGDKGDALHFSAAAARELGRRYATAYWSVSNRPGGIASDRVELRGVPTAAGRTGARVGAP